MKNSSLIICISLLLCSCVKDHKGVFKVADVGKDTLFRAEMAKYEKSAFAHIDLHIVGYVNDSISINGISFSKGQIDKKITQDNYSGDIAVNYKSLGATRGSLKIYYNLPEYRSSIF